MTNSTDVFDEVVILADSRLGHDDAGDILRASLISGAACARSMVTRVPSLRDGWSNDNRVGAALLTEFWAAVMASRLLGAIRDRDQVVTQIASTFAEHLFGSSVSALSWSLATFEEQLQASTEADLHGEGHRDLDRTMAWFFLYWRSWDIVFGDLMLQGRYRVARNLDAWLADPRHADITPPADREGAVLAREITLWGLQTAAEHYQSLRATAAEEQAGEDGAPPGR